jgi:RNA polymerase sigma-70 factor (ECF subfamily)
MPSLSHQTNLQFSATVAPLAHDLRRYALSLTRNKADADDLMQETMLRAALKLHLWEPGTNMTAWLTVMMRRLFLSHFVSGKRNTSEHMPVEDWDCGVEPTQDDVIQIREIETRLGSLSDDHRDVIQYVAIDGASYEEAAEHFRVPVGTIRSRLGRARTQLRRDHGTVAETPAPM